MARDLAHWMRRVDPGEELAYADRVKAAEAAQAEARANAKIAANARWKNVVDRSQATAAARAAGPGSLDYWIKRVPGGDVKAAENARAEFYGRLCKQGRQAYKARRGSAA